MQSKEIRQKFLKFFEKRGHIAIPSASLVPGNDPTVLFTTAGMQQLKPYYVGKANAMKDFGSLNLTSSQKCVRTQDIDEVGDKSHLTFFEMLGNFSFGGYWKKEAIEWAHDFITRELGLKIDYVSVFEGQTGVPEDTESADIWKAIDPNIEIKKFGRADNFWGPTGDEGPCGPTTEIYVDGIEVWNIVFNEYYQDKNGSLEPLKARGVDTGMGLERLVKVIQNTETIFETDLFSPMMSVFEMSNTRNIRSERIVADHIRTSVFMIADGVVPSNAERGYVLRRLLRRSYLHVEKLGGDQQMLNAVISATLSQESYKDLYEFHPDTARIISTEVEKFKKTLDDGLKQFEKGVDPFVLFTSYGFPVELTEEIGKEKGIIIDRAKFDEEMRKHQELSRKGAEQKFKNKI